MNYTEMSIVKEGALKEAAMYLSRMYFVNLISRDSYFEILKVLNKECAEVPVKIGKDLEMTLELFLPLSFQGIDFPEEDEYDLGMIACGTMEELIETYEKVGGKIH